MFAAPAAAEVALNGNSAVASPGVSPSSGTVGAASVKRQTPAQARAAAAAAASAAATATAAAAAEAADAVNAALQSAAAVSQARGGQSAAFNACGVGSQPHLDSSGLFDLDRLFGLPPPPPDASRQQHTNADGTAAVPTNGGAGGPDRGQGGSGSGANGSGSGGGGGAGGGGDDSGGGGHSIHSGGGSALQSMLSPLHEGEANPFHIYHEKQVQARCGAHAINAAHGRPVVSADFLGTSVQRPLARSLARSSSSSLSLN